MGDIRPSHHANSSASLFKNPWVQPKSVLESGQGLFNNFPLALAKRLHDHPALPVKVIEPDWGADEPNQGRVKATWLGHAGFLVQLPASDNPSAQPTRVIFDPIWSSRASPISIAGPKRRLQPPCKLDQLPEFHYVVTSHNHYDHLDWPTIEGILKVRGPHVQFLVPLGNKQWFVDAGIEGERVHEMDWWENLVLSRLTSEGPIRTTFICCPAQHGSGRGILDQRTTLWASWVVQECECSIYHAGDTGYMTEKGPCPAFKEIGEKHGPFDLAMIPIWRGGSLSWVASMGLRVESNDLLDGLHASPAHAVRIHKDIRSRHSIGMHFATFAGSDVEALEPIVELMEARDVANIGGWETEWGFGTLNVGETMTVKVEDDRVDDSANSAKVGDISQEEIPIVGAS